MEHSFLHSKKILLVDDQPELLTLVREILTDDGFCHLASAGTVEQALSVCRTTAAGSGDPGRRFRWRRILAAEAAAAVQRDAGAVF